MYSLSLIVGNLSTPIRLMYRSKERADACLGLISDHPTQDLRIEDDFGQTFHGKAPSIHGRLIENMDESLLAYVETVIFNERVKAKAVARMKADPILNPAGRGVVAPNFNGGIPS